MFRAVVVLSVFFLIVDATGIDRQQNGDYGSNGIQLDETAYGPSACEREMSECQIQLAMQYMDVIQAIQSDVSRNPSQPVEEVILRGVTNAFAPGSIGARHCPTFQAALHCVRERFQRPACARLFQSRGVYEKLVDKLTEGAAILNFACQPEKVRIIEANIPCLSNLAMLRSLESCPSEIFRAMNEAFPDARVLSSCSAVRSTLKKLILKCVIQRVNAASACGSARSNGLNQLIRTIIGRVFDGIIDDHELRCSPSATTRMDLMSMQKKFFEDIYNYQF